MDSVLVLHVSDTHLGYRQYGLYEREQDIYNVWKEIIDKAIAERVDIVIHSGDMFDSSKPPPQAIREAIRGLRRLHEHDIPVVAVMGDHDVPKRRQLPPNAVIDDLGLLYTLGLRTVYEKKTIRTRGGAEIEVAGVTNQRGPAARQRLMDILQRLRPAQDKASILVLHQTLQEVAPDYDLGLGDLPRGYSYYALGHIHIHRGWRVGDAYAAYPGSPEALRVDEARQQPERYVLLAEIRRGSTISLQKLRLESPRPQLVEEIDYQGMDDLRRRLVELRTRLARYPAEKLPLLHLTIRGVPRGEKPRVYKLAETALGKHTLAYRLNIEVYEEELPRSLQDPGQIRLDELLSELLKDPTLAQLAQKVIDIVSVSENRNNAINEILSEVRRTYGLDEYNT